MTDTYAVNASGGTPENPEDEASQNRALAGFWIDELTTYEKEFARWTTRAKKIVKKYRDERPESNANTGSTSRRYPILWSNIETIKPAVYARAPKAVAQRRWKERDPVGRQASTVLERAANFSIECYHLHETIKECVNDYLIVARAQAWVRYEPTLTPQIDDAGKPMTDNDGNAVESLDYEKCVTDFVNWDDFAHSVSRTWGEVWWGARYTYQTRKQLIARFGQEIGSQVPLDWGPERNQTSGKFEKRSKARIAEIWSKRDNKVYFISRAWGERPLEIRTPMYKLSDFFPFPRPIYATTTTDTLVPVPDYIYYQDQAEEIDDLTARIGKLTDSLKLVGIYAGQEQAMLQQLFSPNTDSVMIPVENWAMLTDSKGISGLIDWFPVEQVIKVLDGCITLRTQLIEDIYQITGISDIVRGATDPNETATAQQIKGQWGGLRVRVRQAEIQRFARDIIQISTEIIAQLFQVDTLKAMTGVQLPMQAEKDAAQAQVDQMQQQAAQAAMQQQLMAARQGAMNGQLQPPAGAPGGAEGIPGGGGQPLPQGAGGPPPPMVPGADAGGPSVPPEQAEPQEPEIPEEIQRILDTPSWEDVMQLLHDNELRDFKIDVETDSTIQPDEDEEKQRRVELLDGVGGFFQKSLPMLQTFPQLAPMMGELILFAVRGFRAGATVEDSVEEAMQNVLKSVLEPQAPQKDPLLVKAETESKIREAQGQQDMQIKGALADADIQIMKAKAGTEIEITKAKAGADIQNKSEMVGADIENKGAANEAQIGNKTAASQAAVAAKPPAGAKSNGAAAPAGPKRITFERGPDGKISGATVQ